MVSTQQHIDAAFDQAARLLAVGLAQLIEGDRARRGAVRRPATSRRCGWSGPSSRRRSSGRPGFAATKSVDGAARDLRAGAIQIVDAVLEAVIGHGDARWN